MDVFYCEEAQDDVIDAAYITALQIHEAEPPGDILIFLSGQEDIEALAELLKECPIPKNGKRVSKQVSTRAMTALSPIFAPPLVVSL